MKVKTHFRLKERQISIIITYSNNDFQTKYFMFKKRLDYYFDLTYILFLFLHFLFFLPYVVLELLLYFKIDFYTSIHSKMFDKVFCFYLNVFCRNDIEVYFALISLWFLYVISDRFMKSKNKNKMIQHDIAVPKSAPNRLEDFIGLEGKWQDR